MTYHEMMEICYKFFNTIDFEPFFPAGKTVEVGEMMEQIEEYYDDEHPELIPEEFQGYFFNFCDQYDFVQYLKKRYNAVENEEVISKYFIQRKE